MSFTSGSTETHSFQTKNNHYRITTNIADDHDEAEVLPPHPEAVGLDEGNTIHTALGLAEYFGFEVADIQTVLPDWIPTCETVLFEAYLNLFRQTRHIDYGPNGMFQTSGVDLGLFIAENKIKIRFEDKAIVDCGPNGKACVDRNNPNPVIASTIYIVDIGYAPVNLVDIYAGRIAHEAFHLTFPYGPINSALEELDANRIGSIIVGTNTPGAYEIPDYSAEAIENKITELCANVFGPCSYKKLPVYPNKALETLFTIPKEIEYTPQ